MAGEGWDEPALPGLDPAPVKTAALPPRDKYANGEIVYQRYRAPAGVFCDQCVLTRRTDPEAGLSVASYIRHDRSGGTLLCFRHKQEATHRESLNADSN